MSAWQSADVMKAKTIEKLSESENRKLKWRRLSANVESGWREK